MYRIQSLEVVQNILFCQITNSTQKQGVSKFERNVALCIQSLV